jgi:acetoin:2,6-dichlorophenolindophenol oxidoreductase subunit alpha
MSPAATAAKTGLKSIPREKLMWMYEMLARARRFDEKVQTVFSGFYHSGIGQEAVGVGTCAHLRPQDYLLYAHRGCTQMIAKGLPLKKIFADFLGRVDGTCKGKGAGIMHIADPSLGILGQPGLLGGSYAIAFGAAFSAKFRNTDQVAVVFFGDGTSNRGTFHEVINWAALQKLALVFVCENNKYAMSVPVSLGVAGRIADRGLAFGVPGELVDGQDVIAMYQAAGRAIAHAKSGNGPYLIEADTLRFKGHYAGDDQDYRPAREIEDVKKRDPLVLYRRLLLDKKIAGEEELRRVDQAIVEEVDRALREADSSPKPDASAIFEDLYA